ncbi:acyl-CoA dehydrogenase family protein [Roseibacterium sp. SDUM158016]|nr:acyl-CoA dehydrogenase family protein [Roseibacterium sp. SDUM158016]
MVDLDAPLKTDDLVAFRARVRAFIDGALPDHVRAQGAAERMDLGKEDQRAWHKALRGAGLACASWPPEHGGPGLGHAERFVLERELALAGAPRPMIYGVTMLGPALIAHGKREQQERFLPPILEGDAFWCQGFSETEAGSDLASLRCAARLIGDEYVIDGHKIWTSEAHIADWMFGLFRTDSTGRKQQGITFLLIDMKSPGITVRPIEGFDGTGVEMNQVFFDAVRVPAGQRIGAEGDGWTIAKELLAAERFGNAEVSRSIASLKRLKAFCKRERRGGRRLIEDPVVARRLASLEVALRAVERTELRFLLHGGTELGAEAALLKLRGTEIQNRILAMAADVLGPQIIFDCGSLDAPDMPVEGPEELRHALRMHFNYRKTMIYGGSNEIQRNILAKAVLGL